ncbi:SPOR domain-containing protein [uncultured Phenylobacterium sp.]|uniref:cell division protein FtsN n=1 Tax=uncultured Phenylobacterium sp. TaxID=349273 RepID=UPI0025F7DB32|nr:SPOR domain-containing protein [uncultured Phenylobacterium sp.]
MTDHQRGAYTPPTGDAPLSFDPRQPVRGGSPIPFTLILSVLVLGALVAAIFYFYQSGVRQAGEAPQVVGEPTEAIKDAPPADAQPLDPAAGLQVYKGEPGQPMDTTPPPTFTPGPEQPQARPTTPVTVAQAPPAQAPPAQAAPAIRPAIPATAPSPAPKSAATAPAPKVAPPAPKPPPPVAKAQPEPPKAAAAGGGAAVQIGAVSSTALADRAWNEAVAAAPGLAAGKGKAVEKIERNGGVLYRTAVTGFASRADAQAFCAKLQAAGKSCFVR